MTAALVAIAVAVVWLYLLIGRGRLRGDSEFDRLPPQPAPERWPAVSVIIPARNEAEILRFTLPSALSFFYPQIEITLVDDCSQDGTAETARQTALSLGRDDFRVLRGADPPAGWCGKLWALDQGVRSSRGEWLLFTDADIIFEPELLRDLVRLAFQGRYHVVSLLARLRVETFWDRLLIPSFVFFFHLLYPFHRVRDPRSPLAAAAGGCVLLERAALAAAGGLDAIRGAWIDDLALAGALKRKGARVYLGATAQVRSFRRYGTLASVWQMVARSAFSQLRFSWLLVAATIVGLAVLFGVPVAGLVSASLDSAGTLAVGWPAVTGAASACSLAFLVAAYAPILRLYELPRVWAFTVPAAALLYGAMTVSSALAHTFGRGPRWKDRSFGPSS